MDFKSELFTANKIGIESANHMSTDFSNLLKSKPETTDLLIHILANADYDLQESEIVQQLITKDISKTIAESITRSMRFMFTIVMSDDGVNDTPSDWANDLFMLNIFDEESKQLFINFIEGIKNSIPQNLKALKQKSKAADGWLPILSSINTTTELRAVNTESYSASDDILNYEPNVIDTVGVISVRIAVDDGSPDTLHFQSDRKGLNIAINKLKAALIELDALERFIKD